MLQIKSKHLYKFIDTGVIPSLQGILRKNVVIDHNITPA